MSVYGNMFHPLYDRIKRMSLQQSQTITVTLIMGQIQVNLTGSQTTMQRR